MSRKTTIDIVNLVATVNLGTKLDLKHIALRARNAEYSPKRFSAVIMRIRTPRTTALVFASGKMICTGAKSEDHAHTAAKIFAKIIKKTGITEIKLLDFKVQNMVGRCDMKFPIRLEALAANHASFSTYEPELFPGLIFRMADPNVVLLIFVSGKIVITGSKKREDVVRAFGNIYSIVQQFRKPK
eukprot:m.51912 g.51912  ORF g.51912 m.51912 type:complete len:185 (-) comp10977_c0_seq1:37-591(-)